MPQFHVTLPSKKMGILEVGFLAFSHLLACIASMIIRVIIYNYLTKKPPGTVFENHHKKSHCKRRKRSVCFPRIFEFSRQNLLTLESIFYIQMRHFWMIFKPCARSPISTWPSNHWHRKSPNVQLRFLHVLSIHWNFSWPTPLFYIPIDHFHSSEQRCLCLRTFSVFLGNQSSLDL